MDSWLILNWFPEIATPRGYLKISPKAWRTLHEFGDLTIECVANSNGLERLTLNLLRVADCHWNIDFWENLEWSVGEPLFPLGTISIGAEGVKEEFSPLAINSQGWVYTFSDEPRLVGQNFEKSLENIVTGELGEIIEWHDREQTKGIPAAIQKRIEERERALLRGDWPRQETVLWKDNLAIADPIDFANLDWKAEADRVAAAFGISQPCRFIGPAIWRAFILANNPDSREWEYQRPQLSEMLILQAYSSG